jgi:anti-sigma regulatory factor (Ser/Thr protein kinase)
VLDQRFDIGDLYQVRAAVAAHAAELGLSLELTNDVVIAVHELASNSVRHGPGRGRLRIWAIERTLICEVTDGAAAHTDAVLPEQIRSTSLDYPDLPWPVEPGHGLWLVGKVADRLTVCCDDHGSAATARFDLRP